jgi:CheY-like chemotaxis protein
MMVQHLEHILLIAMTDAICKNKLVNVLGQKNYRFLFAGTGEEVISLFAEHPEINLVIININLPVINGIETIRSIRQLDAMVPVILLVAYINLESLRLAQKIGCNEILQTPVDEKTLEAIILKYLPVNSI